MIIIMNKKTLLTIAIIFILMLSCSDTKKKTLPDDTDARLELIGRYKLSVREPSGLTLSADVDCER